jgi:death on curing protein
VSESDAEPRCVPRTAVEALHADLVRTFGGSHGLRDAGLLESAVDRARNRWSYDASTDVPSLAAAYAVVVARNHAFIDGNKRTAFQTMYVFLALNGLRLVAPEDEVVRLMRDVATGAVNEDALAAWVREHVRPR